MSIQNKKQKEYLLNITPLRSLIEKFPNYSNKLESIGLNTVQDLLLYIPLRYENYAYPCSISNLILEKYATVKGKILSCNIILKKQKKIMVCQINDGSGTLALLFFNFNTIMKNNFIIGRYILVYGKAKCSKYGMEMHHPKYYIRDNTNISELQKTIIPIYPTIKGIKQTILRKIINKALDLLKSYTIIELLPSKLIHNMMGLSEAFCILHRPLPILHPIELENKQRLAQQRLIFEELLAYNLRTIELRSKIKLQHAYPLSIYHNKLKDDLVASLPFKMTNAQMQVIAEIEQDMTLDIPMMRLIQGDVGSGKTLVAAIAALHAITHGKQVALMAPTELLVEQHVNNFCSWFANLGIKVGYLSGKQEKKMQLAQKEDIANGKIKMIIGTHSIIQTQVHFNCLALVIIDEQHKFGVHQRLELWKKGLQHNFYPHQLIMTATPIPRTLAMTIYANLNISTINELPSGRIPITTVILSDKRRKEIIDRLRDVCINEGRQAYWVCTLIEQSKLLEAQAAKTIWKKLQLELPELKIGLIHGRMKPIEKNTIIKNFKQGQLHLIITTTIIEVGVDIPNVSLMIIENSNRLGLSQLHQLRGRIGRGTVASYCVLLYKHPLSKRAKKCLQVLRDSNDGFFIAQKDLEIRGPGELFGTRQTGNIKFKVANLARDQALIPKAQRVAHFMYKNYPQKSIALIKRWMPKTEHYFNV